MNREILLAVSIEPRQSLTLTAQLVEPQRGDRRIISSRLTVQTLCCVLEQDTLSAA